MNTLSLANGNFRDVGLIKFLSASIMIISLKPDSNNDFCPIPGGQIEINESLNASITRISTRKTILL